MFKSLGIAAIIVMAALIIGAIFLGPKAAAAGDALKGAQQQVQRKMSDVKKSFPP